MKNILFFVSLLLIFSCSTRTEFPGFSKGKNGIYFKLNQIGEEEQKPGPGDYITAGIRYSTMHDSVFFNGVRKIQISEASFKGSVDECFMMLSEKEAATFILSAGDFFQKTLKSSLPSFLHPGDHIKVDIEMVDIQTEEEYVREKEAFLEWIDDFGEYEKVILKQFLAQEKLPVKPSGNGIYQLVLQQGNGVKIEEGDTITINYEGKFLNGKFFDSTKKRNQPFQFVYGTEWQVVKGIENALALMQEGEKSLIILPSGLAFGQQGSSTGIVPPYTSLIFEVEVLEVKKAIK